MQKFMIAFIQKKLVVTLKKYLLRLVKIIARAKLINANKCIFQCVSSTLIQRYNKDKSLPCGAFWYIGSYCFLYLITRFKMQLITNSNKQLFLFPLKSGLIIYMYLFYALHNHAFTLKIKAKFVRSFWNPR